MISLTWEQVHAWRLEQQCLVPRLGRGDFVSVVERVIGVQAQVMSAAELSIGARVDGLTREQSAAGAVAGSHARQDVGHARDDPSICRRGFAAGGGGAVREWRSLPAP